LESLIGKTSVGMVGISGKKFVIAGTSASTLGKQQQVLGNFWYCCILLVCNIQEHIKSHETNLWKTNAAQV
jgi:hypothetical protein